MVIIGIYIYCRYGYIIYISRIRKRVRNYVDFALGKLNDTMYASNECFNFLKAFNETIDIHNISSSDSSLNEPIAVIMFEEFI